VTPNQRRHEVANYDNAEWGQIVHPPRFPDGERPINESVELKLDAITPREIPS